MWSQLTCWHADRIWFLIVTNCFSIKWQTRLRRRPLPSSSRGPLVPSKAAPPSLGRRGELALLSLSLPQSVSFLSPSLSPLLSCIRDNNLIHWPSSRLMLTSLLSSSIQIWGRHPRHGGSRHWHHGGVPLGSLRGLGARGPGQIWNRLIRQWVWMAREGPWSSRPTAVFLCSSFN